MIFVDKIAITAKGRPGWIREIAGVRTISYRQAGDINLEGKVVEAEEIVGERFTAAWVHGSHETKLQLRSDGSTVSLKGNVGRWCRADNLFNLGLDATIRKCNDIVREQKLLTGSRLFAFEKGDRDPYTRAQMEKMGFAQETLPDEFTDPADAPEMPWSGARIWEIHLTQNYATGSAKNAKAVIDWCDTQTVARVKKGRLGNTTVVWGSLKYAQTELYVKADEMLAHCKGAEAKEAMKQSEAYKFAEANGIVRLEIKLAKDFLKHRKLTYLGNWTMGTVTELFKEKEEILRRCALREDKTDAEILECLPRSARVHAAAWMQGIDVAPLMSRATFYRHSKVLRQYGIDIAEKRNVAALVPVMRSIEVAPLDVPQWYELNAA